MKRNFIILLTSLVAVCSLSGCDWVKKQLGMATSADIEKLKIEMEQQALRQKQIADSLEAVRLDSLRIAQELAAKPNSHVNKQFYVVIGSYKLESNVEVMSAALQKAGYTPIKIALNNGFTMVAAIGTDSMDEACRELKKISNDDVCPYDAWIYDVNQGLHQ